jgi:hypothetical protein
LIWFKPLDDISFRGLLFLACIDMKVYFCKPK